MNKYSSHILSFSTLCIMLLLFLSSCNNFLHVEKRQYRKGLYVEKLFPFAEKKLKTSLSEDSLHNKNTQEIETLEDYLLSDNTVNTTPEVFLFERENNPSSTIKNTAETKTKNTIKQHKKIKPKIQDDDPDKEGKKQKRDTLDTLIIAFSVLSIIIPFFLPIPLLLAAFSIRRKRRGKSEKDKRWTVAKILLGAAIFVALPVLMAVFLIYSAGFLVWYTFPVFLGLYALVLLAIIYWPWPKYQKPEKKRNESQ